MIFQNQPGFVDESSRSDRYAAPKVNVVPNVDFDMAVHKRQTVDRHTLAKTRAAGLEQWVAIENIECHVPYKNHRIVRFVQQTQRRLQNTRNPYGGGS